ncbi:hypothetical protein [Streptosporangium sp. NBC_01756]|uniref:hypothetical protein n=1 Tax=Streptosporangium sp. NBC_01756 TaxID=2975950 RepID=UPI002DDC857A|nr:hypothetical protein [Streptosporangium sp. NBC_01756]WSC88361.1 hypothetical protein OIE48_09300 [Streptosporangium sp. NBC_01756]
MSLLRRWTAVSALPARGGGVHTHLVAVDRATGAKKESLPAEGPAGDWFDGAKFTADPGGCDLCTLRGRDLVRITAGRH